MGVWWHALAFVTHERSKMSHKPGRNLTQAGPKCHTRAKMSHSHVIMLLYHYYPGLDITKNFHLLILPKYHILHTDYIWFRRKLRPNPLARLEVLLAWAIKLCQALSPKLYSSVIVLSLSKTTKGNWTTFVAVDDLAPGHQQPQCWRFHYP